MDDEKTDDEGAGDVETCSAKALRVADALALGLELALGRVLGGEPALSPGRALLAEVGVMTGVVGVGGTLVVL